MVYAVYKLDNSVKKLNTITIRKRTRKVFRAGGQEKPLALFFSSLDHDGNFEDNLEDKNVDVEKVVATQMKIKNKKCINPYPLIRI